MRLDDEVKNNSNFILLSDFHLSNFDFNGRDERGAWECTFDAMLEESHEFYNEYMETYDSNEETPIPRKGSIQRIDNCVALPWMKFESGKTYDPYCFSWDEEKEEKNKEPAIRFVSIKEAARLNYDHENRHYDLGLYETKDCLQRYQRSFKIIMSVDQTQSFLLNLVILSWKLNGMRVSLKEQSLNIF